MRLLATLLVLVPLSALSQSPDPQPPPPQPLSAAPAPVVGALPATAPSIAPAASANSEWSIGAGISVSQVTVLTTVGSSGSTLIMQSPGAVASLERRLTERTWLAFGVTGSVYRQRRDIEPGGSGTSRWDSRQLAVHAGIRQLLTPGGAPVDVSLVALADVGGDSGTTTFVASGVPETRESSGWGVGADVGLAVERKLGDGLSLRVATPLVGVSWDRRRDEVPGAAPVRGNSVFASVMLDPRLELRLAF
jgi:hypothetical protein